MTKAFIQNGVVIEVARVDPFAIFNHAYASQFIDAPDDVQPGWLYDGESFTAPPEPEPAGPVVPQSITMRQCRLQLLAIGKLSMVDQAIAGIQPEEARMQAQIEWEYSAEVWRSSNWVNGLSAALGLSDAELDNLFITAATL